jgi:hypothetical protein
LIDEDLKRIVDREGVGGREVETHNNERSVAPIVLDRLPNRSMRYTIPRMWLIGRTSGRLDDLGESGLSLEATTDRFQGQEVG